MRLTTIKEILPLFVIDLDQIIDRVLGIEVVMKLLLSLCISRNRSQFIFNHHLFTSNLHKLFPFNNMFQMLHINLKLSISKNPRLITNNNLSMFNNYSLYTINNNSQKLFIIRHQYLLVTNNHQLK